MELFHVNIVVIITDVIIALTPWQHKKRPAKQTFYYVTMLVNLIDGFHFAFPVLHQAERDD